MSETLSVPGAELGRWSTKEWRERWHDRWTGASQTTRTRVQLAVLLVSVLVAYNYSLRTLLATLDQQTPLAYISLVPAIALALAVMLNQ